MPDSDSTDQRILESVTETLDLAVLARPAGAPGAGFQLIGAAPEWFTSCFGSGDEFLERSPFLDDFVHGAAADSWQAAEGRLPSGIWEESVPGGRSRYFEATALRHGNHEVLVVAMVDERHQREREYIQHAHDEALHQRRLAREQEKKEILLDCIVHDLSSPLSTILMNIQHVERQLDRDDLRQSLRRAETQAERQRALVHSIADIFASDLSNFEPMLLASGEGVAIASVAAAMVDACQLAADEKKVRLALEIDPAAGENMHVVGEREHLARVFDNLIAGALHRSPPGSNVTVTIGTRDGQIRTTVDDEGPGITGGKEEQIFAPFAGRGSGEEEPDAGDAPRDRSALGLYSCKMTVELWGGSIGVEANPRGGNRFWFELPEHPGECGRKGPPRQGRTET